MEILFMIVGIGSLTGVVGWYIGSRYSIFARSLKEENARLRYVMKQYERSSVEQPQDFATMIMQALSNPMIRSIAKQFASKYGVDLDELLTGVGASNKDKQDKFVQEWR